MRGAFNRRAFPVSKAANAQPLGTDGVPATTPLSARIGSRCRLLRQSQQLLVLVVRDGSRDPQSGQRVAGEAFALRAVEQPPELVEQREQGLRRVAIRLSEP